MTDRMKKHLWISRITACAVAGVLAFSPAVSSLMVRSFAAENTEDVPGGDGVVSPDDAVFGKAGGGSPVDEVPGKEGDGSLPAEVPGKEGDGSLPAEVPGKGGDGSLPAEVPGKEGDGSLPAEAPGKEGDGSLPAEVPGKEGDGSLPAEAPGKEGDGSGTPGETGAVSPVEEPAVAEPVADPVVTPVVEPEGKDVPPEITEPEENEAGSGGEEEPEEDGEEEEDTEEEEPEEEEEEPEEEEDAGEETDPYATDEVLTPEQEDALADEDAVQAEQAFDYYEAYSPGMFAYQNYWRGWKQGQSAWYSMRNYGCRMTAYSKLLRASGVVKPGNFSPDDFFLWCRENGWLLGTIREIGTPGNCMIDYAASRGYEIVREESISLFKSADPEARKQEIIDKINEGWFVILCSSAHFVYVDELRTRVTQELWVDDSINGENIYKVDRYVFRGSLDDRENPDPRKNWHYRCFKLVEKEDGFETGENEDGTAVPHVLSAKVSRYNEETGTYTVEATVDTRDYLLDRVMFPTWSDNDHADLPPDWEYGTGFAGVRTKPEAGVNISVWAFDVKIDDSVEAGGKYYTYIYAYDRDGNRSAPFTLTVTVE